MATSEPGVPGQWILVGTDFSAPARNALERAQALAREQKAELIVLHVIEHVDIEEIAQAAQVAPSALKDRLQQMRRERLEALLRELGAGPATEIVVSWGQPYAEILRKASEFDVDIIVLGTAGRSADLKHVLFGSTAEKVLRGARCEVLCIPL